MGTHSPAVGAADVSHDTAQKKWGSSSILFDGDSGYLTIPDHADWDMGSGKFTIDFWVRIANLPAGNFDFFSIYQTSLIYMTLRFTNQGGGNYNFLWRVYDQPTDTLQISTLSTITSANTWYHIAVIRGWGGNANDWALCVDGSILGTATTDAIVWPNYTGPLLIGAFNHGSPSSFFDGWIDEFRWVKGVAKWTANFDVNDLRGPYVA
jgi:hypothetical protein